MDSEDDHLPDGVLQKLIASQKTAVEVGDFVIASLAEIETALSPVVGDRGVVALLGRSVHLAGQRHAWLGDEPDKSTKSLDLAGLRTRFAAQSATEAVAGGNDLLQTFRALLSTLIGPSLAERLLRPAWSRFADEAEPRKMPR